jgi:glycosyltransferase involved in cell wall biosynthesis
MSEYLKLSVIIPVYKTENLLRRSIDSVLATSLESYEIIVVADGVSKECEKIAKEYQQNGVNLKYIEHHKNLGLLRARLTGIMSAKGEYIAHLDSDDYIENDIYKKAFDFAQSTGSEITLFQAIRENQNGQRYVYPYNKLTNFTNKTGKFCIENIFQSQTNAWIWHANWNKLIQRSLYENIFDFIPANKHLNLYEDLVMSIFCYLHLYDKPKVGAIDEVGLIYTLNDESITQKSSFQSNLYKAKDALYALKSVKKLLKNFGCYENHKKYFLLTQKKILTTSHIKPPSHASISSFIEYLKIMVSRFFIGGFESLFLVTPKKAEEILMQKVLLLGIKEVCIFGTTDLARNLAMKMKRRGIKVECFLTTSPNVESIDNIKVQTPAFEHMKKSIVVASIGSYKQIAQIFLDEFNKDVITI